MFERFLQASKRYAAAVFAFALLIPLYAFAQDAANELVDLDLKAQLDAIIYIIGQWKSGGALLGTIALVHWLTSLTKLKPLDPFFSSKLWLRPVFALVTGMILAFLSALASGAAAPAALLAGLMAGVGSMGLHELLNLFNKEKQAERAIAKAMSGLASGDAASVEKASALKAELDSITALPTSKERLDALAAWAASHPPR